MYIEKYIIVNSIYIHFYFVQREYWIVFDNNRYFTEWNSIDWAVKWSFWIYIKMKRNEMKIHFPISIYRFSSLIYFHFSSQLKVIYQNGKRISFLPFICVRKMGKLVFNNFWINFIPLFFPFLVYISAFFCTLLGFLVNFPSDWLKTINKKEKKKRTQFQFHLILEGSISRNDICTIQ